MLRSAPQISDQPGCTWPYMLQAASTHAIVFGVRILSQLCCVWMRYEVRSRGDVAQVHCCMMSRRKKCQTMRVRYTFMGTQHCTLGQRFCLVSIITPKCSGTSGAGLRASHHSTDVGSGHFLATSSSVNEVSLKLWPFYSRTCWPFQLLPAWMISTG